MPFESTELLEMLNSVNFDFGRKIRILFKLSKILSQNVFFKFIWSIWQKIACNVMECYQNINLKNQLDILFINELNLKTDNS